MLSQVRGGAVKKPGGFQPDLVWHQKNTNLDWKKIIKKFLGLPDALGERRGTVCNLVSHSQLQLWLACLWQWFRSCHRWFHTGGFHWIMGFVCFEPFSYFNHPRIPRKAKDPSQQTNMKLLKCRKLFTPFFPWLAQVSAEHGHCRPVWLKWSFPGYSWHHSAKKVDFQSCVLISTHLPSSTSEDAPLT